MKTGVERAAYEITERYHLKPGVIVVAEDGYTVTMTMKHAFTTTRFVKYTTRQQAAVWIYSVFRENKRIQKEIDDKEHASMQATLF